MIQPDKDILQTLGSSVNFTGYLVHYHGLPRDFFDGQLSRHQFIAARLAKRDANHRNIHMVGMSERVDGTRQPQ